jgi:ubiquinone/menaquinone biosynthesis C-methylase UbiE
MRASRVARAFVDANVRLSRRLARALSIESDKPFWQRFEREAGEALVALPPGATAIDLGGGRRCVYAGAVPPGSAVRLVAVDVSAEELALNRDVDETVVADVAQRLPFADGSVDLILSRTVLEHVPDVPAAAREMARVTRPGGVSLHFLPCRYSLFGLAARLLPFEALLRLLHAVSPGTRGQVEFEVHYDRCHPAAIAPVFGRAGFRRVSVEPCWAQAGYFEPAPPLFLAVGLYDRALRRLGLRRLASYMIVRAQR